MTANVSPPSAEAVELALRIADETAADFIRNCGLDAEGRDGWLLIDEEYRDALTDDLRYLTLRGLIKCDEADPWCVRILEVCEGCGEAAEALQESGDMVMLCPGCFATLDEDAAPEGGAA